MVASGLVDGFVEAYVPVLADGEQRIGTVYLRSSLDHMWSTIGFELRTAVFAIALAFLVALILSMRLQRTISAPILRLVRLTKQVSAEKNYALRARKHGEDEVGALIDSFNAMLEQVEAHERKMLQARHEAETASRAKTEFLANMSHELRTPLNAIIGFSEILAHQLYGALGNDRYRDYAADIHSSGTHLLEVVNDILDISKVEAGQLNLNEEPVSLASTIEKAMRILQERAEAAGLSLVPEVEANLPPLRADARLVKQSLVNLLSNSIKFTPAGGSITARAARGASGGLVLAVIDTGIGIAAEDIPRALAPFGQIDSALNRRYEGTGLGLPLVKSFAELHGGRLTLDSTLGAGTTVTMHFPPERVIEPGADQESLALVG
jgi:signal transduction histidine kinase